MSLPLLINSIQKGFKMLMGHCRCVGEKRRKHEISLDKREHAHTRTHTCLMHTRRNIPTLPGRGRSGTTEEKGGQRIDGAVEKKKKARGSFFPKSISMPVHISQSLCCLSSPFLLSLLPGFRSSQTDRSCQTFDVFISLGRDPVLGFKLSLCLPCVRVAVSHFFFFF